MSLPGIADAIIGGAKVVAALVHAGKAVADAVRAKPAPTVSASRRAMDAELAAQRAELERKQRRRTP